MHAAQIIGVNLKVVQADPNKLLFQDNIFINEDFKASVMEPYLRSLYSELSNKSPDPSLGIARIVFIEVIAANHTFRSTWDSPGSSANGCTASSRRDVTHVWNGRSFTTEPADFSARPSRKR
ncbi:MAG: hypothetical protein P4M11_03095 [Candidatus Pacebacteria bacterium]|nr:hypothetical protein [Candidatus Paceibacterota bacterium]